MDSDGDGKLGMVVAHTARKQKAIAMARDCLENTQTHRRHITKKRPDVTTALSGVRFLRADDAPSPVGHVRLPHGSTADHSLETITRTPGTSFATGTNPTPLKRVKSIRQVVRSDVCGKKQYEDNSTHDHEVVPGTVETDSRKPSVDPKRVPELVKCEDLTLALFFLFITFFILFYTLKLFLVTILFSVCYLIFYIFWFYFSLMYYSFVITYLICMYVLRLFLCTLIFWCPSDYLLWPTYNANHPQCKFSLFIIIFCLYSTLFIYLWYLWIKRGKINLQKNCFIV